MTTQDKLKKLWNSPLLFIQNLMKVVNKDGELKKFKLNPEQKYLLQHETKYNVVLKSRQLGISTLAVAQSIYIATTKPQARDELQHNVLMAQNDHSRQHYY